MFILKKLREIGTERTQDEELKKRVVFTNTLSIALSFLILSIGTVFYLLSQSETILIPAIIELMLTFLSVFLNYRKQYEKAGLTIFTTQCFACLYFGSLLGEVIELQGMLIFLISIIYLLFQKKSQRKLCLIIAIITLILLRVKILLYSGLVNPLRIEGNAEKVFNELTFFGVIALIILVSAQYVTGNDRRIILEKKNYSLKNFFAQITHEMRSPLNAIGLIANILKKETQKDPALKKVEPYADMLVVGSTTTRNLVNNVLDMAEIEAGKTETSIEQTFFVRPFFSKLIEFNQFIGKSRNISISLLINQMPSVIISDPLKLSQVMNNLLSNAIKYGTKNSIVTVTLARSGKHSWTISVKNEGLPIDQKTLETIFEPYVTVKTDDTEGTGLGLYIVRNKLLSMDGRIEVDNVEDEYIVFTVTLPLRIGKLKDVKREEVDDHETNLKNFSNAKVLIGEDELSNANALALFLIRIGCQPEIAHNGKELLSKAMLRPPDLIMMDYDMPLMNGIVALQQLKENPVLNKIPVIVTTGDVFTDSVDKMLEAGADNYILKPIEDIHLLQRVLNKYLSRNNDELKE